MQVGSETRVGGGAHGPRPDLAGVTASSCRAVQGPVLRRQGAVIALDDVHADVGVRNEVVTVHHHRGPVLVRQVEQQLGVLDRLDDVLGRQAQRAVVTPPATSGAWK